MTLKTGPLYLKDLKTLLEQGTEGMNIDASVVTFSLHQSEKPSLFSSIATR